MYLGADHDFLRGEKNSEKTVCERKEKCKTKPKVVSRMKQPNKIILIQNVMTNFYLKRIFIPLLLKKKQFRSNLKAKLVVLVALTFSLFPFVSIGKEVLLYLSVFYLKRVLRTACREKETCQTTAY